MVTVSQSILTVPQNSKFDLKRAKQLLLLVQEAHHEFDKAQSDDKWDWDKDNSQIDRPTPIGGNVNNLYSDYNVIKRYGFGEYYWRNILGASIDNLLAGIRHRVPFGFVVQKGDEIFVVFRGTMTPAEWVINFQFRPGCEDFLGRESLGKVHLGFSKIYTHGDLGPNPLDRKDDLPSIKEDIEQALKKCSKNAQVYVTGHSLGGALATLATLHIKEMNFFTKPPILYAFANPRAGGKMFANNFNGLECYRIANSEDIVPTVPLASVDLTAKSSNNPTAQSSAKIQSSSNSNDRTAKSLEIAKPSLLPILLPDLDYHHIGQSIYFTVNKGTVADNHIVPTYIQALG